MLNASIQLFVFGMGTGVTPKRIVTRKVSLFNCQALDLLLRTLSLALNNSIVKQLPDRPSSPYDWFGLLLYVSAISRDSRPLGLRHTCLGRFLRKEVIQPHLPIRLPCYDFTPVNGFTFDSFLLAVGSLASGPPISHGVTGGVYKARERIHRDILIRDY